MIEVYPRLFIGSEADYERTVKHQGDWWVVHACKDPYHRQLLGYRGRGAPKNHPEYLVAKRGKRLFLNLIDADDPAYIPKQIIDTALHFIDKALKAEGRVLVHCNRGESRAPAIGFLYLLKHTHEIKADDFANAEAEFRKIYPGYTPARGMRTFVRRECEKMRAGRKGG